MASDDDDDKKVVVVSCKCIEISDDEVLYGAFDFKTGGFMFRKGGGFIWRGTIESMWWKIEYLLIKIMKKLALRV